MTKAENLTDRQNSRLEIRKYIDALPARVFEAWTEPEQIAKWWGPKDVSCIGAKVDLKIGGEYQIKNLLSNGSELLIYGVFVAIEKPDKLVFTWNTDGRPKDAEMVTVNFKPHRNGTEIVLTHERIPTKALLKSHNMGWIGCLKGLQSFLQS